MKYAVVSGQDCWREILENYTAAQALCEECGGIGGAMFYSSHLVEIWDPAHPKGDIMPNMIIEIADGAMTVEDLGGHGGRLMAGMEGLVQSWRVRYKLDDLRLEPADGRA